MSSIKVSIVIPTYNRKNLLKDMLESLFNQTYPEGKYEIIVCDDGSNDGTEEMVRELAKKSPCALKYYKQVNRGPASARNMGIKNAMGKIIGFTDDDCVVSNTWIENAVPYFEDIRVGGVMGCTIPYGSYPKKHLLMIGAIHTQKITEDDGSYGSGNIFYRKKVLNEVDGFDPEFIIAEDVDLGLRVKGKGYKILFDKNILIYHKIFFVPMIKYLKSLKKDELNVLLYKKHPEIRKNLTLGFIHNKKNIYPIFCILYILFYSLHMSIGINVMYALIFILVSVLSYMWGHVLIDSNIKKYPLRIVLFVRYVIPDTLRLYHAIHGSIHYRFFLI